MPSRTATFLPFLNAEARTGVDTARHLCYVAHGSAFDRPDTCRPCQYRCKRVRTIQAVCGAAACSLLRQQRSDATPAHGHPPPLASLALLVCGLSQDAGIQRAPRCCGALSRKSRDGARETMTTMSRGDSLSPCQSSVVGRLGARAERRRFRGPGNETSRGRGDLYQPTASRRLIGVPACSRPPELGYSWGAPARRSVWGRELTMRTGTVRPARCQSIREREHARLPLDAKRTTHCEGVEAQWV